MQFALMATLAHCHDDELVQGRYRRGTCDFNSFVFPWHVQNHNAVGETTSKDGHGNLDAVQV